MVFGATFICSCGHRATHHESKEFTWGLGDCKHCNCKQYKDSGLDTKEKRKEVFKIWRKINEKS